MTGPIDRVVVPLDAASENTTAIDTAARLAARAKAPLHGVFVEDEDLLHLAGLPFARQVTHGAGAEALTTEQVELHLRAAAERARQELAAAAKRHRVKSSFEIVRGASTRAVAGASARDLVVAGAQTRPVAGQFHVECRWWSSVAATPSPFLLARHAWSAAGTVVLLLFDREPASARLLAAGAAIAAAGERPLTVICPPDVAGARGFEKWVGERLGDHQVHLQIEVAPTTPADLHKRISELDCRLLAIAVGVEADTARLRDFAERFACDLLVVR